MGNYRGFVNRIDVIATNGILPPRCLAFVNKPNSKEYIQVETSVFSFQSALELSCILKVEVDVTYDDVQGNILTRVTILDRE